MPWSLQPGDRILRKVLHGQFGGGRQGGIAASRQSPNILVFSDPDVGVEHGYVDHWDGNVFHYVGEGQTGNQQMDRGNKAIRDHYETNRALRVFWGAGGTVQYAGEFELDRDDPWYPARAKETGSDRQRDVIVFRLLPLGDTDTSMRADGTPSSRRLVRPRTERLTTPYRRADESPTTAPRDPFEVDPNTVDRGLAGHARTQNQLAALARSHGYKPLSPGSGDPDFDLCWREGDILTVVEVKSLTPTNEVGQLRLGLGQVLHYRHQLQRAGQRARAVLAVEAQPEDEHWNGLCAEHGVVLTWPDVFATLFTSS